MRSKFQIIMDDVKRKAESEDLSLQDIANGTGYTKQTVFNILNLKAGMWKKAENIVKYIDQK